MLINYAAEMGFDPLIATNWYHITKRNILAIKVILSSSFFLGTLMLNILALIFFIFTYVYKGGNSMLMRYGNKHTQALMDTFPEIGLERERFVGLNRKVKRKT